jgi:hypothetical protein
MRWAAIVFLSGLLPAASLDEAATELGRRLRGEIGREPFRLNVQSLASDDGARALVEVTLRRLLGNSRGDSDAAAIDVTLSRNLETSLLVAETRRGDSRVVMIVPYDGHPVVRRSGVRLEARVVARHAGPGPLLDVAFLADRRFSLDTERITALVPAQGDWAIKAAFKLPAIRWPRDPVGRLVVRSDDVVARLPGVRCSGAADLSTVRCDPDDSPWELPGGVQGSLQDGRNFFRDSGLGSFFSAIRIGEFVIAAHLDGRLRLHGPAAPVELAGDFGSFISLAGQACGDGPLVLATSSSGTAVRAFRLAERKLVAAGESVDLGGEVGSLWGSGAIVRAGLGESLVYRLEVRCGP